MSCWISWVGSRHPCWRVVLLGGLIFGLDSPLSGDDRKSFTAGSKAFDRGEWAEVARHMRAAIRENPAAGKRVHLYGMVFRDYIPHYYLGLAQYHQGDCAGALEAWEESERQSVVRGDRLVEMKRLSMECRSRLPTPAPPQEAVAQSEPEEVAPSPVTTIPETVTDSESEKIALPVSWGPPRRRQNREWQELVDDIDRLTAEGLKVVAVAKGAGKIVAADWRALDTALREVDPVKEDWTVARLTDLRARLKGELVRLRERMERTRQSADPPVRDLPTSEVGPKAPPELRAAAEAFLSAEYQEVLSLLKGKDYTLAKARATRQLLRAAAYYSLYLQGGAQDEAMRSDAEAAVKKCQEADPELVLRQMFFSPPFIDFFQETR